MVISLINVFCIILGWVCRNCFPIDQNCGFFKSTNSGIMEVIVKFHMHGRILAVPSNPVIDYVKNICPSTNCPLNYEK